ncbi:MAG TPA: response regulator [Gemmatimonadales bacterium]|nr:response regulator [Gemmatimonadales bacterium]
MTHVTDTAQTGGAPAEPVVLIANAQEWASRSLESVLRPSGYSVLKAFNERDTLRNIHERRIDAVILDTSLGEPEVLNLCRVLRADPRLPTSMPILVTSAGRLTRPHALAVLRAGGNGAWGEPLDTEEFLLRLEGYVRVKRDGDKPRPDGSSGPTAA